MMTTIGFVAGFALCWFTKTTLTTWVSGTEATAAKLEALAAALRAKV